MEIIYFNRENQAQILLLEGQYSRMRITSPDTVVSTSPRSYHTCGQLFRKLTLFAWDAGMSDPVYNEYIVCSLFLYICYNFRHSGSTATKRRRFEEPGSTSSTEQR